MCSVDSADSSGGRSGSVGDDSTALALLIKMFGRNRATIKSSDHPQDKLTSHTSNDKGNIEENAFLKNNFQTPDLQNTFFPIVNKIPLQKDIFYDYSSSAHNENKVTDQPLMSNSFAVLNNKRSSKLGKVLLSIEEQLLRINPELRFTVDYFNETTQLLATSRFAKIETVTPPPRFFTLPNLSPSTRQNLGSFLNFSAGGANSPPTPTLSVDFDPLFAGIEDTDRFQLEVGGSCVTTEQLRGKYCDLRRCIPI